MAIEHIGHISYWIWDSFLDLGIVSIDEQHRRIVDFINELNEAHVSNDSLLVAKTLDGLVDYTITHFAFEEELMAAAKYPLTAEHMKTHASFATHIRKYKRQYEEGRNIINPLTSQLKLWLIQHIDVEDRKYVPYVKKGPSKSWIQEALTRFFGLAN